MSKKREVCVVVLRCKATFLSIGRTELPEVSFIEGEEYDFVHDAKRHMIFTVDETGNVHSFTGLKHIAEGILDHREMDKFFSFVRSGRLSEMGYDEVKQHRMKKLSAERYNYMQASDN